MEKYIFFDFDGVLNTFRNKLIQIDSISIHEENALKNFPIRPYISGKYLSHNIKNVVRAFRSFDSDLIDNANYLMSNIDYIPVISSAWRNTFTTDAINHIMQYVGLKYKFVGAIPRSTYVAEEARGLLIADYIITHKSEKQMHITIDDNNIGSVNNLNIVFYKTNSYTGLTKKLADDIIKSFGR